MNFDKKLLTNAEIYDNIKIWKRWLFSNRIVTLKDVSKMTYTYFISKNPTREDFKALCKRIDELYPEYEQRDGKKYADGAENARWEKGELAITAELEAAPAVLTVTSDEALPELEREYRLKDKERRMHGRREQQFFYDLFFSSGARVKFLLIPGIIYAVYAFLGITMSGHISVGEAILGLVLAIPRTLFDLGMIFGWLLLIPAGAAVIWAARFKNPVIIKLLMAVLPVLSTVYACIFEHLGYYADFILWSLVIFPFISLPVLYIAALPYLAIDEIACRRLLKLTGERPSAKMSVICWALSFGVSAAVLAFAESMSYRF